MSLIKLNAMIDPLLSLSFNLHSQKGVYALLLGSGISRSAEIPTGWEITLDLVAKLIHLEDNNYKGEPLEWYKAKYKKEPEYSSLLSAIAPTSAAQQKLLKKYFEPSTDEREEGKKQPTEAHRAIARLVRSGHIRVILTTNFDRLLEKALEGEGITPIVIASSDAAKGAPPLAHSKCTIIKIHGDYLDNRIKNSEKALSRYDKTMNTILDQVLNEYGLIVSGWSADYDIALKCALERAKARRYPMYWTGIAKPTDIANALINLHTASFTKIDSADHFFTTLFEKVNALEEFDKPHPLSTQAAVATLKKYLSEDKYRIQLRDFLLTEAKQAKEQISLAFAYIDGKEPTVTSASELMQRIESACERLMHLFAIGSFYTRPEHVNTFFDAFQTILSIENPIGGTVWRDLKRYPSLLIAYTSGIAALLSENYTLLKEFASRPSIVKHEDKTSIPLRIYSHSIMSRDIACQLIPGMSRRYTPLSDYLFDLLSKYFEQLYPNELHYEQAFDKFEYLWCLLNVDAQKQKNSAHIWVPYGSFIWKKRDDISPWLPDEINKVITESNEKWPQLKQGLFGGKLSRLKDAYNEATPKLDEISSKLD